MKEGVKNVVFLTQKRKKFILFLSTPFVGEIFAEIFLTRRDNVRDLENIWAGKNLKNCDPFLENPRSFFSTKTKKYYTK